MGKKFNISNIDASTDVYCIFGNPVKHSLSPIMQNAAFAAKGINAVYTAFEIEDIKSGIRAMKDLSIRGASVTIPFKEVAVKYLDGIDSKAERINAVNTLLNKDGLIHGYNTDTDGAINSLLNNNININGAKVLVLGNGGSARTISIALSDKAAEIIIAGRNRNKMMPLVNDLSKYLKTRHYLIKDLNKDILQEIDIVINATSVGMIPDDDISPVSSDLIMKKHAVFDIVYTPDTTKLLSEAINRGCRIVRGMDMLVNQGAAQFEIWTGQKAPVHVMKKVLKKYIKK